MKTSTKNTIGKYSIIVIGICVWFTAVVLASDTLAYKIFVNFIAGWSVAGIFINIANFIFPDD